MTAIAYKTMDDRCEETTTDCRKSYHLAQQFELFMIDENRMLYLTVDELNNCVIKTFNDIWQAPMDDEGDLTAAQVQAATVCSYDYTAAINPYDDYAYLCKLHVEIFSRQQEMANMIIHDSWLLTAEDRELNS